MYKVRSKINMTNKWHDIYIIIQVSKHIWDLIRTHTLNYDTLLSVTRQISYYKIITDIIYNENSNYGSVLHGISIV